MSVMFSESSIKGRHREMDRATWPGAAFIVEALFLLAFLVASLAIFMSLFGSAHSMGSSNRELEHAITYASNTAERFASDPLSVQEVETIDGFQIRSTISPESTGAGVYYHALITVSHDGEKVYELATGRYVSGRA